MQCALKGQSIFLSEVKWRNYFKNLKKICLHKHCEKFIFIKWCSTFIGLEKSFDKSECEYWASRLSMGNSQGIWHIPTLLRCTIYKTNRFHIVFSKLLFNRSLSFHQFIYRIFAVSVCVVLVCNKLWRVMLSWSLETKLLLVTVIWLSWNSLAPLSISS